MDDANINLRWRDLGEGITYRLQMAEEKTFQKLLLDRKLDQPEAVIKKPEKAGVYYIRTSAIDPEGYEGAFSLPQSFEIEEKFPYTAIGVFLSAVLAVLLL
jgi:hypothetical protein